MNGKLKIIGGKLVAVAACVVMAVFCWSAGDLANAQTSPPPLPPGVQDVVKLSQAGMGEDVILAQIKNSGATYSLNADQIIYLNKIGITPAVLKALLSGNGAPAAAATPPAAPPAAPAAPPIVASTPPPPTDAAPPMAPPDGSGAPTGPPPTYDNFHDQLAPYGAWVQLPPYGWCWRPTVAQYDPYWRPYGNAGHWAYTDGGWAWQSDYPWGDIAFHYGRWAKDSLGWFWTPAYDWAPAWVTWRHSEGYVGWAPLPPAAVFRAGVGLEFDGRVALDVGFGLGFDAFTFVPYNHFWDRDLHAYFLPRDRLEFVFGHSVILNGYRMDHGRFFIDGLGRDRIAGYTHHEVIVERPGFRDFHRVEPGRGFREERHDRFP